jgi:hypothetical protein
MYMVVRKYHSSELMTLPLRGRHTKHHPGVRGFRLLAQTADGGWPSPSRRPCRYGGVRAAPPSGYARTCPASAPAPRRSPKPTCSFAVALARHEEAPVAWAPEVRNGTV